MKMSDDVYFVLDHHTVRIFYIVTWGCLCCFSNSL